MTEAEATEDTEIVRALESLEMARTARLVFDAYGRDVLSFLLAMIGDQTATQWALAHFGEQLWRGCDDFGDYGRSVRCWVYSLARKSVLRALSDDLSVPRGEMPLPQALTQGAELGDEVRAPSSRDPAYTPRELRGGLPVDDQMLLILRVDRGLSYRELARVMHGLGAPLSGTALEQSAQRLQKHFRAVKAELLRMARGGGA